jgi:hypothetical protein
MRTFYLGDGALDFDTGADVTAPVVVYSAPNEGSSDTGHLLTEIRVVFDRAMDPAITSLRVDDGVAPFDAPVTWNLARTIGTLGVAGRMHTGRTYRVDLRAALDLSGQPIDRAHPYLVDGVLDFRTRTPTGEQCRDEASIAEATARLPSGGYGWSFGPGSVSIPDDGASCPFPGSSTSRSPDAVVRYVKTSAAGSAGGAFSTCAPPRAASVIGWRSPSSRRHARRRWDPMRASRVSGPARGGTATSTWGRAPTSCGAGRPARRRSMG